MGRELAWDVACLREVISRRPEVGCEAPIGLNGARFCSGIDTRLLGRKVPPGQTREFALKKANTSVLATILKLLYVFGSFTSF